MNNENKYHKVFLIHGIRTGAEWLEELGKRIDEIPGFKAVTPRFEFFDVFRFWFPFKYFRNKKIKIIKRYLEDELV